MKLPTCPNCGAGAHWDPSEDSVCAVCTNCGLRGPTLDDGTFLPKVGTGRNEWGRRIEGFAGGPIAEAHWEWVKREEFDVARTALQWHQTGFDDDLERLSECVKHLREVVNGLGDAHRRDLENVITEWLKGDEPADVLVKKLSGSHLYELATQRLRRASKGADDD